MKRVLYVTVVLLSCELGASFPLFATARFSTISEKKTQNDADSAANSPSASDSKISSELEIEQSQMAAWVIEASQAAKEYVEELDQGRYAESWNKGSHLFKKIITQKEWEAALNASRKPLGKMQLRAVEDVRIAMHPHGLPKGPYMVVIYKTSFKNAPQAEEVLTLHQGSPGKWHVLTYAVASKQP